ncbi:MAG: Lycopene cyclase [Candidatus Nomurabacteria bacterium]|nr:Lycopene cyclase [Candidatus Nomurabacteria bacterium]
MQLEYLISLLVVLLISFILQNKFKITLYKDSKKRFLLPALFFFLFILVDSFAIWRGYWAFPSEHNVGLKIGLMPIEDYILGLVIPYFVLVIYNISSSRK